jgi:hypothetical protein
MTQPAKTIERYQRLTASAVLVAALLGPAPASLAQEEPAQTEAATAAAEDVAGEPQQQQENDPAPVQPTADDKDSPFDYRSSEKISEDLSVSFPVDI